MGNKCVSLQSSQKLVRIEAPTKATVVGSTMYKTACERALTDFTLSPSKSPRVSGVGSGEGGVEWEGSDYLIVISINCSQNGSVDGSSLCLEKNLLHISPPEGPI